jgi:ABC-type dipeptide/oligopeptide/nickel transport system permease subunit
LLDPRAIARFKRNRGAVVGGVIVLALLLFAVLGPILAGHDPYESDFTHGVSSTHLPVGPGPSFMLGADRLYRDMFARLAVGARLSLLIAFASTAIACAIGGTVGITAGYFEGEGLVLFRRGPRLDVDSLLMRLVDIGLSFPFLLLVMAIGAVLEQTTVATILLTLGVTGWLGTARVVRSKTMQVRHLDYVVAARALGQSTPRILFSHVLPPVMGPLIVLATISVAQMIVAESVLSYLGVGIAPPTPTWGHMLFEGQDIFAAAPWILLGPAIAILLAVFGFNLLGEGLRDALDPQE